MEVAVINLPYKSRSQVFRFYFLGDVHWGSACCDEEEVDRALAQIRADPSARVFLMGDLAEFIARDDWRFREANIAKWVQHDDVGRSEEEYVVAKLFPIKDKILGAIQGNHELTLEDEWNQTVHRHICERLGIRDLGYMALVRLRFAWRRGGKGKGGERTSIDLLLHHGWGGGRTDGADVNRLDELLRDYNCDWAVAGHTHRYLASKSLQHEITCHDQLGERVRLKGRSGTFLKTVEKGIRNYTERNAGRPLVRGCLVVTFSPLRRDFVANV